VQDSAVTRRVRRLIVVAAMVFTVTCLRSLAVVEAAEPASLPKIGIIGTGKIGSALARHWVKAGYEVFVSSRHPEELKALVTDLGNHAHAGTSREAAAFGSVIVVSVPYAAMPQIGNDLRSEIDGKIILDTSNPVAGRDGDMAIAAQKKGAGMATAEFLHSRRVVRAFNCIPAGVLASEANRTPERLAIPIGGDDPKAIGVAQRLVSDAGFDPVVVGSLAQTRQFDLGQPLASGQLSAKQLNTQLGR
jgi:predicted dinucleotide-binding enzyme